LDFVSKQLDSQQKQFMLVKILSNGIAGKLLFC
jgi:hypothetical protein